MKKTKSQKNKLNKSDFKKNKLPKLILIALIFLAIISGAVYFNNKKKQSLVSNPNIPQDILDLVGEDNIVRITVLNAKVIWNSEIFRIINLENRTWKKCTFELNRGSSSNVFSFQQATVDAGSKLDINHNEFKNNVGESYNYKDLKPQAFLIRCADVNGRVGLYNGSPR